MGVLYPLPPVRRCPEWRKRVRFTKPLFAALLAAALVPGGLARTPASPAAAIQSALSDPSRPPADVALDPARKPADLLAFAGIRRGMAVADLFPGSGYFTRLFSITVGPGGRVVALVPDEQASRMPRALTRMNEVAAEPGRGNVTVTHDPLLKPWPAASLDLVWTSLNYHDIGDMGVDTAAFNKVIYDALKPGGVFIVIDHAAAPGAGRSVTKTLHRIDPALVRREVEAAGFRFDGESGVLANPADERTLRVFDPAIRSHTDQFAYRFRKPARPHRRR